MKIAHNRANMIGKVYNSWKVLEYVETKGKTAFYKALCLECNKEFVVDGRNLRSGLSKRCVQCGLKSTRRKQTGKMKSVGIEPKLASYMKLYSHYKIRAIRKHREFTLSLERFIELLKGNCKYCGTEPRKLSQPLKGSKYSSEKLELSTIKFNGLDRVDSNIGYTEENSVTCCEMCNKAKLDWPIEVFEDWIKRLCDFRTKQTNAAAPTEEASD